MIARFEILPFARGEEEAAQLPEPAHLTVTTLAEARPRPHGRRRATRLRALGHTVTVHLAARMVRDRRPPRRAARKDGRGRDRRRSSCVAGDATPPEGPYSSAVELLPLIAAHPHRPSTIGIAGYPEGHPLIDDAALADALAAKTPFADYVTTQLCFDPEAILRWIETRTELPVIVGIPGMVDRKKLLEISMRVGVGPSLRYLRKQGGIRKLLRLSGASADHALRSARTARRPRSPASTTSRSTA